MTDPEHETLTSYHNEDGSVRVLVAIDMKVTDYNSLLAFTMEGRTIGSAVPDTMISTAIADVIASSANFWPHGVEVRMVTAQLGEQTAFRAVEGLNPADA